MISFKQYLEEVRGHNVLYHATSLGACYNILKEGQMRAVTIHEKKKLLKDKEGKETGISLTRSFFFATTWVWHDVIFVFNRDKLKQKYELIPIQYFDSGGTRLTFNKKHILHNEDEEFLITKKGLPVSYIEKIYVASKGDGDHNTVRDQVKSLNLNIEVEPMPVGGILRGKL